MSVQFGRWNFEGEPPAPDYMEKVNASLAPYGPDSDEAYSKGDVKILYRAFHTTKESIRETQPYISSSGAVITWDGRLDNRAELVSELDGALTISATDVAIVSATYEKWGPNCFAKLIGDWAVAIWNPNDRSLILAKDPIGTRHLYYSFDSNQVVWSTILDPLVRFAGKPFAINEEYIAGWFSYSAAAHLTPYDGIRAVPPSSSVLLRPGKHTVSKNWDFDPAKKIRYSSDAEYEEHFRTVFAKAVERRLRSDRPVLAELSGGMDSSSIVCMADAVIACGIAETSRLDTMSWYDDSYDHIEPDFNERPYFTKVEEKRGRRGCHINTASLDVGSQIPFVSDFESDPFAATPAPSIRHSEHCKQYAAYMKLQGYRVVLSGIGGDEVTGGGVPTPRPELQNLLARARFFKLAHQLNVWAVKMRKPQIPLLWEAVRGFVSPAVTGVPKDMLTVPWFLAGFVRRNYAALCGYPSRLRLFGPLPSFQENIVKLDVLRRTLAAWALQLEMFREVRFPYLDRNLLEFLYAVPREQIVRVGQRRSLMKRALVGIVPDELLNRRRKVFVPPDTPKGGSTEWPSLVEIDQQIVGGSVGIIDSVRFLEALQKARRKKEITNDVLTRTVALELWLRRLTVQGVLTNSSSTKRQGCRLCLKARELQAPVQPKSSAS